MECASNHLLVKEFWENDSSGSVILESPLNLPIKPDKTMRMTNQKFIVSMVKSGGKPPSMSSGEQTSDNHKTHTVSASMWEEVGSVPDS